MSQAYPYMQNSLLNHSKYLTCFIQDGKIYTWSTEGTQQIGVGNQVYNELKEQYDNVFAVTTQYKDRLVELGEIAPELTPDDIIKQQAEQLRQSGQALAETQKALAASLERLESLTAVGANNGSVEADQPGSDIGTGPVKNKKSAVEGKRAENGA